MAEPHIPDDDPITSKSYALHYLVASVILIATLFWALWDEDYGQRPWKRYQNEFVERYTAFLDRARSTSQKSLADITNSEDYKELDRAAKDAQNDAKPREAELQKKIAEVDDHIAAVQAQYTDAKARIGADTYEVETANYETTNAAERRQRADKLNKEKNEPKYEIDYPGESGKKLTYVQLEERYLDLKQQKAELVTELGQVQKPYKELQAKRDAYIADHLVSLSPAQLRGLKIKYEDWDPKIMQINVPEANIVDRCESCHMGAREPLTLTADAMTPPGHKPDEYSRAFVSHSKDLLKVHDPDKFGCSPCHQGNGRATTSVEKAHGYYEHWLWPLFKPANMEAGCQTCHAADMFLNVAPAVDFPRSAGSVISYGKYLYQLRGCVGCHRYEGYDKEPEDLLNSAQQIKQLESQQNENLRQAKLLQSQADQAETNEEATRLNREAEGLIVTNSKLAGRIEQLDLQQNSLLRDVKKVGPNLKEIRAKLNKNWIPVWLHKPTDFRPTTKMPNFRLSDHQIQAISAYLWQSALKETIPHQQPGNADHGKQLFFARGCLACHSIGEGDQMQGGDFAANLTRVGEKANYDYLVRWIHDPRQRLRPYCPYEKKDIGPEDYAKKGLPYQFDLDHTTCPNDGHQLQVQNMTVMPVLRLSVQDAQDIATFLISQREKQPSDYPDAPFMDDPNLKAEGARWIRQFGCAGCHEIPGFEDEGRIGTELTQEGSKPIERLDFALLTHDAEVGNGEPIEDKAIRARLPEGPANGPWYDHKGFFEHKLAMPNIYDKGKIKSETEALRMPDPHLNKDQIRALVTFLLGSQDTSLPESYQNRPGDTRRDVQEGWWVVRKYNCMGCHQFMPGQQTVLMTLPQYQDAQEKLPPKLLTEGARVDPEWLLRFLSNPALSTTDTNRNGVRPYLDVRMPTFNFSPNELRKLVRFFMALSQQPQPYIQQPVQPLSPRETDMARSLFSSTAAPCLKCHATGDPAHDRTATAPNFLLAKERLKPGWAERWIIDPQAISPGTSMPSNLFHKQGEQWVFSGPTPPSFNGYASDHTKLLVRYIFQLTPEEQHAISSRMPRAAPAGAKTTRNRAPGTTQVSAVRSKAAGGGSR